MPAHRHLIVLRGHRDDTLRRAQDLTAALLPDNVLRITRHPEPDAVPPGRARALLGQSFDAVVIDLHDTLNANLLGQCHGLIRGGGAMILRLPPPGHPPERDATLQRISPYTEADATHRLFTHVKRAIARAAPPSPTPLTRPSTQPVGNDAQRQLASLLASRFIAADANTALTLLADRGRGKSSTLGLAIAKAQAARPDLQIALTATHHDALAEVVRFAGPNPPPLLTPEALLNPDAGSFDVVVVDEAAQLPMPWLKRLVHRHPNACLTFATTTHGYEGTGRGFVLRFLGWLERQRAVERLTLTQPIRWSTGDPLERFVFDALLLDADLPRLTAQAFTTADVVAVELDRDALLDDLETLRGVFGLLVQAHYRTTPNDLKRLLDAPNVRVHALRLGDSGPVVAATLVAEEGGLPQTTCEALLRGTSIRGHALPETLVSHLGRVGAGRLTMIRSVRIATHPMARRRGLAALLVEHIHDRYAPDLFGTLFGATPELLQFRRAVGYRLVRLSASRGARTGEPAAVMLRPCTAAAQELVEDLRQALARDLPLQLELLDGEGLKLDPRLEAATLHGLPTPQPLTTSEQLAEVRSYAYGPRTFESAPSALIGFADTHCDVLERLEWRERALLEGRALNRWGWRRVMAEAQMPSMAATMRGLRRAFRALVEAVETSHPEDPLKPSPESW